MLGADRGVRRPPEEQPGGIVGLYRFLVEHGEAVEADLQAHYQVRLSDLFAGRLTWRRLGVFVRQLPQNSRSKRQLLGDAATWGPQEYLLAVIGDAVRLRLWQAGGGKGRRPKPIPRPGEADRKERHFGTTVVPMEVMAEKLAARRARERVG